MGKKKQCPVGRAMKAAGFKTPQKAELKMHRMTPQKAELRRGKR